VLLRKLRLFALGTGVFSVLSFFVFHHKLDDAKRLEATVRNDFRAQKGITLTNVGFARKSDYELHGFAAYKVGQSEFVKACVASREENTAQFVYSCYWWIWGCRLGALARLMIVCVPSFTCLVHGLTFACTPGLFEKPSYPFGWIRSGDSSKS
jgi:hypothetical protein